MIPSLAWEKDADGYEIEVRHDSPPKNPKVLRTIADVDVRPGVFIVGKGGARESFRLQGLKPRVYEEFANIAGGATTFAETLPKITDSELLRMKQFAGRYGLPWRLTEVQIVEWDSRGKPDPKGEVAPDFWRSVHGVRRLLSFIRDGRHTDLIELFPKEGLGNCHVSLMLKDRRPPNNYELVVHPHTLLKFIEAQVLCLAEQGSRIKDCKNCGRFFTPKSEKRETCSGACRQAWRRRKAKD